MGMFQAGVAFLAWGGGCEAAPVRLCQSVMSSRAGTEPSTVTDTKMTLCILVPYFSRSPKTAQAGRARHLGGQ